jgi:tetratricopeptide (TPR) repeat protein
MQRLEARPAMGEASTRRPLDPFTASRFAQDAALRTSDLVTSACQQDISAATWTGERQPWVARRRWWSRRSMDASMRARICGVDQAALSARTLRRDTHMLASDILMRLDRPTEALAHLDEALEIDPDRPDALGRRAELRLRQGDHEGAIADLDTFLRLSPLPYEHPDVRKAYELRASAESARHARTRAASAGS